MQAKDVMTPDVITVDPDMDVASVAKIMINHRISGVLVLDNEDQLVGVVSEGDLMRRSQRDPGRSWWLSLVAYPTTVFSHGEERRVRDIMTRHVVSVGKDTSLSEVASILVSNHIKRVPVIENGSLLGLVSRADVLQGLASLGSRQTEPTVEDWNIRAGILELVRRRGGVSMQSVNAIVVDREVYLWGIVEDDEDKAAVREAAVTLVGASNVHNFLATLSDVARETK